MTYGPLDRFQELRRIVGVRKALWVGPWWLLRAAFEVVGSFIESSPSRSASSVSLHWTLYRDQDETALLGLVPWLTAAEIARRQQAGHHCLLGWMEGDLVYQRWYTTKPAFLEYLGLVIQPEHGDLISIDAYTHHRARDQGVHSEALRVMLNWASERGLERDIALIARWNQPSLHAAIEKIGRMRIGSVERWRIGPWKQYRTRGSVRLDDVGHLRIPPLPATESKPGRDIPGY